jgi:hypothetical protein
MSDRPEPSVQPPASPYQQTDSTVEDWHGQEVQRDTDAAEQSVDEADGDMEDAEPLFDERRPAHSSEATKVPPSQRAQPQSGST